MKCIVEAIESLCGDICRGYNADKNKEKAEAIFVLTMANMFLNDDAPNSDLVEVVRCNDCIHDGNDCGLGEEGFCSYGVRKLESEGEE